MRKDISKENKHNQSKVKRRPSGLGAPLSWNPAHSIFTSVCVIYLFIYASSQPADYMLCLFMLNGFLPDLSSVLDTDHILPVGCKDGKKKVERQNKTRNRKTELESVGPLGGLKAVKALVFITAIQKTKRVTTPRWTDP